MKMIVGRGNPGRQYAATRHNIGFVVVDRLADRLGISVSKLQHKALVGEARLATDKVLLVKPQTYMNNSGEAVAALVRYYRVEPADLLVIYDDMDLPVGKIRLRTKGGAGTHNGMRSIIDWLGTEEFARLRVGIDRPSTGDWADYVLAPFQEEELTALRQALEAAEEAALTFVRAGIVRAMNEFNQK